MVEKKEINRKELYRKMVESERYAYEMQDTLLKEIEKWFVQNFDEVVSENTKIILAQGGYIQIRSVQLLDEALLADLAEEFDFQYQWYRHEDMVDFRNVDPVKVTVYEYVFLPVDMTKILGDNQVDVQEEEG